MTRISFSIPGEPQGKDRPRASARVVEGDDGPEAFVRMHTTAQTKAAEQEIARLFRKKFKGHVPWTGAVLIRFTAVFATPKSFNRALQQAATAGQLYCIKKPDKDNIEKLIVDALNEIAWHDDAQVMGGGIKRYGSPARVDVTLELLQTPDAPPTPGQKRLERRVALGDTAAPRVARKTKPTKSDKRKRPDRLQQAIDAAIARDAPPAPPPLTEEEYRATAATLRLTDRQLFGRGPR